MRAFTQLKVWQAAHQLTLEVYGTTSSFPRDEAYGLTSQLRRASSSIAANIAEGGGRDGDAELRRFCSISAGSASELEYHLLLAKDLGLISADDHGRLNQQTIDVKRMLAGLMQKLKADG